MATMASTVWCSSCIDSWMMVLVLVLAWVKRLLVVHLGRWMAAHVRMHLRRRMLLAHKVGTPMVVI